jgi:hypothetical protein
LALVWKLQQWRQINYGAQLRQWGRVFGEPWFWRPGSERRRFALIRQLRQWRRVKHRAELRQCKNLLDSPRFRSHRI